MYQIPKEINSETKLSRHIYVIDFGFLVICFIFSALSGQVVHSSFRWVYWIFCTFITLWFLPRSRENAGMRKWRAYMLWLRADFKTYNGMRQKVEEVQDEKREENKSKKGRSKGKL